jgi:hypothetical protein
VSACCWSCGRKFLWWLADASAGAPEELQTNLNVNGDVDAVLAAAWRINPRAVLIGVNVTAEFALPLNRLSSSPQAVGRCSRAAQYQSSDV